MPTYHMVSTNGSPAMNDVSERRESTTRAPRESAPGNSHGRRESSVPRRESSTNRIDGSGNRRDGTSRSKLTLEHSAPSNPQLMLHDPVDGPWQRAKDEWKDPHSWFTIDDCGRMIDVPHSFGSKKTIYKWSFFIGMMATIIYLWSTAENAWFLGDLDHWALLAAMIYQTLSLGNGHFQPPQPAMADGVNAYVKAFWIIFEVAAHLQLLATFMFWAIVYPQQHATLPIDFGMFALHGLVLIAVWIDGMLLNRIPVRIKHYFFVLAVDTLYIAWTVIHAAAQMGTGTDTTTTTAVVDNSRSNTDAVYIALDWSNSTVQSVFLMIAILTFVAPFLFLFQYCMSLYTFPWIWNGSKSRKCLEFDMCMSANFNRHRLATSPSSPGGSPAAATPKKKKKTQPPLQQTSETSRTTRPDQTLPLEIIPTKKPVRKGKKSGGIKSSAKSTDASVLTNDFDDDFVAPPPRPKASQKRKKKPAAKQPQQDRVKPKRHKSLKSLMDIA